MSVGTFRVVVLAVIKPNPLSCSPFQTITICHANILYYLACEDYLTQTTKIWTKRQSSFFSIMVDISIKRLACTNEMKLLKVFSSLEKMSGGSGRNRWLIQMWLVCHWHPVSFKSLSFEKWQYVDTFSGSVCFTDRIQLRTQRTVVYSCHQK